NHAEQTLEELAETPQKTGKGPGEDSKPEVDSAQQGHYFVQPISTKHDGGDDTRACLPIQYLHKSPEHTTRLLDFVPPRMCFRAFFLPFDSAPAGIEMFAAPHLERILSPSPATAPPC